ncbi:T-complex protein 1 subunit theta-like [Hibiscus syriacus]|uniref:T-complex protein 1 subunit theta-like n=1 Tax=Hibiscus syriacus TaxID=106335 RepID=UPI0019204128|nr:T-complex protein 1 subunit theta-like [Hibiscus syriacus]XP_038993756.1 T-complex protein 1 subunit theta-like [Hibiscus syriacus]XP_038993757.1 T-complex protein 1 subunit theta-like [Hibiscus syriacus]
MVFVGRMFLCQISSKFELRHFCRTAGTSALLKLSQLMADDLGFIDSISVEEIGGSRVTVVRSEEGGNKISTVLLRGSTDSILDDLERDVDDGVNTYKAMCRDSRIVLGATTTEIELVRRLKEFSFKEIGLLKVLKWYQEPSQRILDSIQWISYLSCMKSMHLEIPKWAST